MKITLAIRPLDKDALVLELNGSQIGDAHVNALRGDLEALALDIQRALQKAGVQAEVVGVS